MIDPQTCPGLELPHGKLLYPAYLPDATYGMVRAADAEDLERAGVEGVPKLIFCDYGANTEFMESFNVKEAEKEAARAAAYELAKDDEDQDDDFGYDEDEAYNDRLSEQAFEAELAGADEE